MQILLVDAFSQLESLQERLSDLGHEVLVADQSDRALEAAVGRSFDLGIVDHSLACLDGKGACEALLKRGRVLVLGTEADPAQRLACLRCGADDFLPKPVNADELLARVEGVQRRQGVVHGSLRVDVQTRRVEHLGASEHLTEREFDLLTYFLGHPGEVLSSERLAADVWGMPFETGTNVVAVYMNYLRKKLRRIGSDALGTVRGRGYRLLP